MLQTEQTGWLTEDGRYSWSGAWLSRRVTPVWAAHIEARKRGQSEGSRFIAEADGWLIYRYCPEVPEAVARIRWDATEPAHIQNEENT